MPSWPPFQLTRPTPSGLPSASWTAYAAGELTSKPAVATTPTIPSTGRSSTTSRPRRTSPVSGANLEGRRLPRRERREKEAELARWRVRYAAVAKGVDDLAAPERQRLDKVEANVTGRLSSLHEQRERRDSWFAGHPESARRLVSIERDVETLTVEVDRSSLGVTAGRGASRDLPWLRDTPVIDRGPDLGFGR